MIAELLETLAPPLDEPDHRLKWTRTEVERFEEAGLWGDRKFELLEGVLYDRRGKNKLHALVQTLLNEWAHLNFPAKMIRAESPIDVSERDNPSSQPMPDMVITSVSCFDYAGDHPAPNEIALVIEVSDTTLREDLGLKTGLYARAGIREYWVIDIRGRRLIVQRTPQGDDYTELKKLGENESITPLFAPDKPLILSSILPTC
jgi:hypothetical protein